MSKKIRFTSILLAAVVALNGLPLAPAWANPQVDESSSVEPNTTEEPSGTMKFVETGFDPATGVLTMSLKIKPNLFENGVKMEPGQGMDGDTPGEGVYLQEGVFMFQTDSSTVIPITNPEGPLGAKEILPNSPYNLAIVGKIDNKALHSEVYGQGGAKDMSRGHEISDNFNRAMNTYSASAEGNFMQSHTALVVSQARAGATSRLDCYLQFRTDMNTVFLPVEEDGYVKVVDLYFQCKTRDSSGALIPATDEKALYSRSFHIPTAEELPAMVSQFHTSLKEVDNSFVVDESTSQLAMGGAGFRQKYVDEYGSATIGSAYYYGVQPEITSWRTGGLPTVADYWKSASRIENSDDMAPGLYYANMDSQYILEGFQVGFANTYDKDYGPDDGVNPEDIDFYVPVRESSDFRVPRYSVPTRLQQEYMDSTGKWIPYSYSTTDVTGDGAPKQVPLRYNVFTTVSGNSITNPETADLAGLLDNITWKFAFRDNALLEDVDTTPTGEEYWIETIQGDATVRYYVEEAEITPVPEGTETDNQNQKDFGGCKVQKLYTDENKTTLVAVTPLGITLDMVDGTDVSYLPMKDGQMNEADGLVKSSGILPQLRLSPRASHSKSYLWSEYNSGVLCIQAYLTDETLTEPMACTVPLSLKLYREASTISQVELGFEKTVSAGEEPGQVPGFALGIPYGDNTSSTKDEVMVAGIPVTATLYDQYYIPVTGNSRATVTLEPDPATAQALAEAGRDNPFQVVANGAAPGQLVENTVLNSYTIKYKDGKDVKNALSGTYLLKAACSSLGQTYSDSMPLAVLREPDYLKTIGAAIQGGENGTVDEHGVTTLEVSVPPLLNSEIQRRALTVQIDELSNQWRTGDVLEDPKDYDIVKGIRNVVNGKESNLIDQDKARQKGIEITFSAEFPPEYEDPANQYKKRYIDLSDLESEGVVGYTTNVPEGAEMQLTVTAARGSETCSKVFRLVFTREASVLNKIAVRSSTMVKIPNAGGQDNTMALSAVPRDQYDTNRTWGAFGVDPTTGWSFHSKTELPAGVTLTGQNNSQLLVTREAEECTIQVYAKCGSIESAPVPISIVKDPSIPIQIKTISYKHPTTGAEYTAENGILVPAAAGQPTTVTPQVTVIDQYDDAMALTDYSMVWEFQPGKEPAGGRIHLNAQTGAITVDPSAPDARLYLRVKIVRKSDNVTVVAFKNYDDISAKRGAVIITDVFVEEKSVPYPETGAIVPGLTATFSSQYGEREACTEGGVEWFLLSATQANGTELVYGKVETGADGETVKPDENPTISFDGKAGTFSAGNMRFTSRGAMSFVTITDPNLLIESITVVARYGNKLSATQEISLTRNTSVPKALEIPASNYSTGLGVPSEGVTTSRELVAYVRDQYGVNYSSASAPAWEITNGPFPGIFISGRQLNVTHEAEGQTLELQCTFLEGDVTLKKTVTVYVEKANSKVASLTFQGIKNSSGLTKVVLPGVLDGASTYVLSVEAKDQFGQKINTPVEWELVSGPEGVTISDRYAGRLSIAYSSSTNERDSIVVQAIAKNPPGSEPETVTTQGALTVTFAEPKATYAVVKDITAPKESLDEGSVVIPQRNEDPASLDVTGQAMDQYEREINAPVDLRLLAPYKGVTLESSGPASAVMKLDSTVSVPAVVVVAYLKDSNVSRANISSRSLPVTKGIGYAYEMKLGEDAESPVWQLPLWNTDRVANVADPRPTVDYPLSASVVDQYGSDFGGNSQNYYPTWEFKDPEGHEGVSFASDNELMENGVAKGKTVILSVDSTAVPRNAASKEIELLVWYDSKTSPDYAKTVTVTLARERASAHAQYFDGADKEGYWEVPRPTEEQGSVVHSIFPTLYDQYGIPMEGSFRLTLNEELLASQGVDVKRLTDPKEKVEPGQERTAIGYEMRNNAGALLAAVDLLAGTMTLYHTCTLQELHFTAASSELGSSSAGIHTKSVYVRIETQELKPTRMELNEKAYSLTVEKTGEDPVLQHAVASVYDQYGQPYGGNDVKAVWELLDEEGLSAYVEYVLDEKGNETEAPKMDGEYVLTMSTNGVRTAVLQAAPENFAKGMAATLSCELQTRQGAQVPGVVPLTAKVNVDLRRSGGGNAFLTVTFDPGEYGLLVGLPSVECQAGQRLEAVPGVKTHEGYGFIGWTTDGVTLVNPLEMYLYEDTLFVAVYRDVTTTAFLEGYADGSVRPESMVTRAEFTKMVIEALGGYDKEKTYPCTFKDVKQGKWYTNYIGYAQAKSLVGGYGDNTFRPNAPVTRGEAAKILALALGKKAIGGVSFEDINEYRWYAGYVEVLVKLGVLGGYGDGTFRPENPIKRAEAVKMIILVTDNAPYGPELENIRNYSYCPFIDIKRSHWAYAYVLRAAGVA